ncbi:MAG: RecA-family ATPase-like protein [Caulobacter sp.]|nr:RecA-family ATPase-like protein [Caulobacter sp.]
MESPMNTANAAALELEAALLGAVLAHPPTALPLIDHLKGEDFLEGEGGVNAQILEDVRRTAERGEVSLPALAARFAGCEMNRYVIDCYEKSGPATGAAELGAQVAASGVQRRVFALTSRVGMAPDVLRRALEAEQARLEALDTTSTLPTPTPFVWCDPALVPMRDWLYGRHLIRRFVSCTVAPGGLGKSALLISEALAMITGKSLLGVKPRQPLKVWLFNGEDPLEEMQRRVLAACLHFRLTRKDVEGPLFLDSGRDRELTLASQDRNGLTIHRPLARHLVAEIKRRGVDVLVVDPFASSHEVNENDNMAINKVVGEWGVIAQQAGCAIELVHHTRKGGPGQTESRVEDARGATSLPAATRDTRVLNAMTKSQGEQWDIDIPRAYFRVDYGKANMSPPGRLATWRRLVSVDLENGPVGESDEVGVVEAWSPPSVFQNVTPADTLAVQQKVAAGDWRSSHQCANWVGVAVAEVLGLDLRKTSSKARIKAMIEEWLRTGALVEEERADGKRMMRMFVTVGVWLVL